MACSCQGKKRQQFEVVSPVGKVLFTSGSEATAQAVSRRYKDSTVREKAKTQDKTSKPAAAGAAPPEGSGAPTPPTPPAVPAGGRV